MAPEQATSTAVVQPRLHEIEHAGFPFSWLFEAADAVFAYPAVRDITITPQIGTVHEDSGNFTLDCDVWFAGFRSGEPWPDDDVLDTIPSVRKIERLADTLVRQLPFDCDDEGNLIGSTRFEISRSAVIFERDFEFTLGLLRSACISAQYINDRWECRTHVVLDADGNIPVSDYLAAPGCRLRAALGDRFAKEIGIPHLSDPVILNVDISFEEQTVTLDLELDAFAGYEAENV